MLLFSTPIITVLLVFASVLHLLSAVLKQAVSRALIFINIFLHIATIPLLIYYKFSIEDGVLFYMISVTVYTFFWFIREKKEERARNDSKRYFEKKREEFKK